MLNKDQHSFKMGGWIRLYRQIAENPIWLSEKFSDGQAWVDLLLLANHKPGYLKIRGNIVDIGIGECGYSQISLAKRWKWSRNKVARFLNFLEQQNMIKTVQQKSCITTLISIVNYRMYQYDEAAEIMKKEQQTIQQEGSRRSTNKNDKNEKTKYIPNGISSSDTSEDPKIPQKKDYINFKNLFDYWNKKTNLIPIRIMSDVRKRIVRGRINEYGKEQFHEVIDKASKSNFLNGNNQKGWKADFDWIMKPANFVKILEGNYDNDRTVNGKRKQIEYPLQFGDLSRYAVPGLNDFEKRRSNGGDLPATIPAPPFTEIK